MRKLSLFYEIYKDQPPLYLYNLIPAKTPANYYPLRTVKEILIITRKYRFFENFFTLQLYWLEWFRLFFTLWRYYRYVKTLITRLSVSDIAPLTVLFCNCTLADLQFPAVKKYCFNIKSVYWFGVINQLAHLWLGRFWEISHLRDFWEFWNYLCFTRAISKLSKMHSGSLSQIALPNMWLLVLISSSGSSAI